MALALLAEQPAATLIAFACMGLGLANVFPLVVSAASRTRAPALAIATVSTGGYAGVLIGPPIIGFAADIFSLPIALGFVVGLCGLITALAGLVRVRSRRRGLRSPRRSIPLPGTQMGHDMDYLCG